MGKRGKNIDERKRDKIISLLKQRYSVSYIANNQSISKSSVRKIKREVANAGKNSEILKEAQGKHLDEIRGLIERWKKSIVMPPVIFNIYSIEAPEYLKIEHDPLFEGVKGHLPRSLWTDYETWKQKVGEVLTIDRAWPEQIKQEAKTTMMNLKVDEDSPFEVELKPKFDEPIIAVAKTILLGGMPEYVNYDAKSEIGTVCSLYADGVNVLDIIGDISGETLEAYRKRYHEVLQACLQGETMDILKTLLSEIQDLQEEIHKHLEEALLRRDYIRYKCKFCPGEWQPR